MLRLTRLSPNRLKKKLLTAVNSSQSLERDSNPRPLHYE